MSQHWKSSIGNPFRTKFVKPQQRRSGRRTVATSETAGEDGPHWSRPERGGGGFCEFSDSQEQRISIALTGASASLAFSPRVALRSTRGHIPPPHSGRAHSP